MPWDFGLILLFLGVVVPWRGHVRLKKLLARPHITSMEKVALYGATIAFQWLATLVVGWRALARGITLAHMGLESHQTGRVVVAAVVGAAVIAPLHWLNLRRTAKLQLPAVAKMKAIAVRILPLSLVELLPYLALAITAGLCEEFLYRGFVMAALLRLGWSSWLVVLVSSVLFGLAHAYQGKSGIVGTALLGVLFAVARLAYDSLVPVMVWHAVVDIVAGAAGPRYLLADSYTPVISAET